MYFYKTINGLDFCSKLNRLNDKELEKEGLIEITEEEFNSGIGVVFSEPPVKTKEQIKTEMRIQLLKDNLAKTDYQAIKFAEGELSAEEYGPVLQQRRAWRAEINQLEALLK